MMTIVNIAASIFVVIFAVLGVIGLFVMPIAGYLFIRHRRWVRAMLAKLRQTNPDATQEDAKAVFRAVVAEEDRQHQEAMDWAEELWAERERRAIYSVMAMKD
jgi:type VI protein secretion system component VasK